MAQNLYVVEFNIGRLPRLLINKLTSLEAIKLEHNYSQLWGEQLDHSMYIII